MLPICLETQVLLSRQYQQKTLPHAIIIQGIAGTGKETLAQWLIALFICQQPTITTSESNLVINQPCGRCKTCLLNQGQNYPDHLLLTSENKTLGVDDIRRGNSFLEKTAHLGHLKTILIPDAETMTIAAANALLKTLEEPSANSFIVLLVEDLDSLLPTIISRCAIYSIRPAVGESLLQQLGQTESSNELTDKAFLNLSQLAELTDDKTREQYQSFNDSFIGFISANDKHSESKLLAQLIENKHGFRWLEKIISNLVRKFYFDKSNTAENTFIPPPQVLYQVYQAIIDSNKLIKSYTQTNRQFVAEKLVMTINTIVNTTR